MLNVQDLSVNFGERTLFKDVNLKFMPGNCYGLIGANGAGKSTLLKVFAGQFEASKGSISIGTGERLAMLSQDQFAFDDFSVMETVLQGHARLFEVMQERETIYSKPDFSEADGLRAADLEMELAEMNGYEAESEAAVMLTNLGVPEDLHFSQMADLEATLKLRVLLAQALFGNPDILLLDEPTNQLDMGTIQWLEDFLIRFPNTVIVVSHDRHFLNNVATHIVDIDYNKIKMYVGNYDFWYQSSQLAQLQRKNENKRSADKIKELEAFIRRFSANASKSKQATSRKNLIDKIKVDDLPASSRRFPFVDFKPERPAGRNVLAVEDVTARSETDGEQLLNGVSFVVNQGDKIAFIGPNDLVKTTLFDIISGEKLPESGSASWGNTITTAYFPKENTEYFEKDINLIDWLRQYAEDDHESVMRGFLGRMLFSGDEVFKSTRVLSGGEKVRCMLSRMMLTGANALILDEPTNHLDLESITALNDGLIKFPEVVLFSSHDFQFVNTIANRIIEVTPRGIIDRSMSLEEYLADERIKEMRAELYEESVGVRI